MAIAVLPKEPEGSSGVDEWKIRSQVKMAFAPELRSRLMNFISQSKLTTPIGIDEAQQRRELAADVYSKVTEWAKANRFVWKPDPAGFDMSRLRDPRELPEGDLRTQMDITSDLKTWAEHHPDPNYFARDPSDFASQSIPQGAQSSDTEDSRDSPVTVRVVANPAAEKHGSDEDEQDEASGGKDAWKIEVRCEHPDEELKGQWQKEIDTSSLFTDSQGTFYQRGTSLAAEVYGKCRYLHDLTGHAFTFGPSEDRCQFQTPPIKFEDGCTSMDLFSFLNERQPRGA